MKTKKEGGRERCGERRGGGREEEEEQELGRGWGISKQA